MTDTSMTEADLDTSMTDEVVPAPVELEWRSPA